MRRAVGVSALKSATTDDGASEALIIVTKGGSKLARLVRLCRGTIRIVEFV